MSLIDLFSPLLNSPHQTSNIFQPDQSQVPAPTLGDLTVTASPKPKPQTAQMVSPPNVGPMAGVPDIPSLSPSGASQTPQPASINYDNSGASQAVNQALLGEHPLGGSANPGIYGLLPQSMQHGTLRNVLGALGDALLVSGGRQPLYEQRMERQEIGQAMAGMDINDPQSVAAATQRIAATGAADSPEFADKIQQQAEQAALRKQYMDYNNNYRQQVIDDRTQYHANETEARNQNLLRQRGLSYSGLASSATTPQAYKAIYDRANASAAQLDPKYTAEDMGLVRPEDWSPGAMQGFGMTGNNVQQSTDRASQRQQSEINSRIAASSRVQAAGTSAAAHLRGIGMQTDMSTQNRIRQLQPLIDSGTATPAQQQEWSHYTQAGRSGSGRSLPPGLTPGGSHAPPAAAIAMLQHNPGLRQAFDAKYGAGASAKVLGH